MKRTPLRRRAPLRSRKPMSRSKPIRKRAARPARRPAGFEDQAYLDWLETQPGRSPRGLTPPPSIGHHLRHTETGAPMGGHIKDDRRAISLSWENHGHIHKLTSGPFKGWSVARVQAWENEQLAEQRARYLASAAAGNGDGCGTGS